MTENQWWPPRSKSRVQTNKAESKAFHKAEQRKLRATFGKLNLQFQKTSKREDDINTVTKRKTHDFSQNTSKRKTRSDKQIRQQNNANVQKTPNVGSYLCGFSGMCFIGLSVVAIIWVFYVLLSCNLVVFSHLMCLPLCFLKCRCACYEVSKRRRKKMLMLISSQMSNWVNCVLFLKSCVVLCYVVLFFIVRFFYTSVVFSEELLLFQKWFRHLAFWNVAKPLNAFFLCFRRNIT